MRKICGALILLCLTNINQALAFDYIFQVGPGGTIAIGDNLFSINREFRLTQQADGNLVLYNNNTAVWATYKNGTHSIMQKDGNFVQYNGSVPVWSSQSAQLPTEPDYNNYSLALLDDGLLIVQGSLIRPNAVSIDVRKVVDNATPKVYPLKVTDLGAKPSIPSIAMPPSEYWYKLGQIVVK